MSMSWEVKVDMSGIERFRTELAQQLGNPGASGLIRTCLNEQWPKTYLASMQDRFDRLSRGGGEWPPLAASTIEKRRGGHQKELGQVSTRLKDLDPEYRKQAAAMIRKESKRIFTQAVQDRGEPESEHEEKRRKNLATAVARSKVYRLYRSQGNVVRTRKAIATAANVTILRNTGTLFRALMAGNPGNVSDPIPQGIAVGIGGSAVHEGTVQTIGEIARIHQEGLGRVPVRRIVVDPDTDTTERMTGQLDRAVKETRKAAQ